MIEIVTKKRLIDLDTPADSSKRTKTTANGAAGASAAAAPVVPPPSKRRVASMNVLVKQEVRVCCVQRLFVYFVVCDVHLADGAR